MTYALARLAECLARQDNPPPPRIGGRLTAISAASCQVAGLSAHVALGDRVQLGDRLQPGGDHLGEVIRVDAERITIKPYSDAASLALDTAIFHIGAGAIAPDLSWRGRTLDALARPIDGRGPLIAGQVAHTLDRAPPSALERGALGDFVRTGIRALDVFTPLCRGQRIGLFAGSGVGKSTLLAMMARSGGFDTIVIALVGERGREVREWLEGPMRDRRADTIQSRL